MLQHVFLKHMGRIGEGGVDVAIVHMHAVEDVGGSLRAHPWGGVGDCILGAHDHGQGRVFDLHEIDRVLRDMAGVGDGHGDGFANKGDFGPREDIGRDGGGGLGGARAQGHAHTAQRALHVLHGDHRMDAGQGAGAGHIQARDARMGVLAAQEGDVQLAGQLQIIQIFHLAPQQGGVFQTFDGEADLAGHQLVPPLRVRAACRAASTMGW